MRIACLGWGSLVWDLPGLPIGGNWSADGPLVSVEFLRESRDHHITLVLHEPAPPVRSLWAEMNTPDLETAIEALRHHESTASRFIGAALTGKVSATAILDANDWLAARELDAPIWTDLPPNR